MHAISLGSHPFKEGHPICSSIARSLRIAAARVDDDIHCVFVRDVDAALRIVITISNTCLGMCESQ